MLTAISGNGRSGYSCALNKENDIFNNDISPFGTEGLTCLIKARQKEDFVLTGLLCPILPPINMTDSDKLTGYASMLNVCADNVLDKQDNFSVSPSANKGKGLNTHLSHFAGIDFCPVTSPKSHHNLPLQATGDLSYSRSVAPQWAAGFERPSEEADISRFKVRFFYVCFLRCAPIMVRRNGGASALAGFIFFTGRSTPIRLASLFERRARGPYGSEEEATTMATAYTRPEFIDTYWIIPEYETTPYGKVSLTRQDRRTFIALFKDSRLIWAGRQPVNGFTECVKRTESPKQDVKRSATITEIVTVQGVANV